MGHVFVSYSRRDGDYVKRLVAHLEDEGLPVWADHQISSGDRWDASLRERIDTCVAFVLVMTPDAEESHWVGEEVARARTKGKPIFPLLLDGEVFFGLSLTQHDVVLDGSMPPPGFTDRLRAVCSPAPVVERAPASVSPASLAEPGLLHVLTAHTSEVTSAAFAPDGSQLATASRDGTVRVWHAGTGALVRVLEGHGSAVFSVAYAPAGHRLASAGADRTVRIWDTATGAPVHTATGQTSAVYACAYSPDRRHLALAGGEMTARVLQADTGAKLRTLAGHSNAVYAVAFSPDGRLLATASGDTTVRVWRPDTGERVHTLDAHTAGVYAVAFSPGLATAGLGAVGGVRLATAGSDRIVRVWDGDTEALTLAGHERGILALAYSPDGRWLASAGRDRTIRIWHTGTGEEVRTLSGHTGPVGAVAFSPDGNLLASTSHDTTVRLWSVA